MLMIIRRRQGYRTGMPRSEGFFSCCFFSSVGNPIGQGESRGLEVDEGVENERLNPQKAKVNLQSSLRQKMCVFIRYFKSR